jgi:hypothetical protein
MRGVRSESLVQGVVKSHHVAMKKTLGKRKGAPG